MTARTRVPSTGFEPVASRSGGGRPIRWATKAKGRLPIRGRTGPVRPAVLWDGAADGVARPRIGNEHAGRESNPRVRFWRPPDCHCPTGVRDGADVPSRARAVRSRKGASDRPDLNRRPPGPKPGALAYCATIRSRRGGWFGIHPAGAQFRSCRAATLPSAEGRTYAKPPSATRRGPPEPHGTLRCLREHCGACVDLTGVEPAAFALRTRRSTG